jgi:hypothetical protein
MNDNGWDEKSAEMTATAAEATKDLSGRSVQREEEQCRSTMFPVSDG